MLQSKQEGEVYGKVMEKKWLPHMLLVCRGQQQPPTHNSQSINDETRTTTTTATRTIKNNLKE